jgi:hypothetical protein
MSRYDVSKSRRNLTGKVSRSICLIGIVLFLAMCAVGCGTGGSASNSLVSRTRVEAERLAKRMPLGTSVQAALDKLGRPNSRFHEGRTEALHYGRWNLEFDDGRLARKSTERIPLGGVRPRSHFDEVVLGLTLGESIPEVRPKLGRPERIIETWEGQDEKVTVLGYGGWQITFVDDRLEERSHS